MNTNIENEFWKKKDGTGPILNAYPDSFGGRMENIVKVLGNTKFRDVFSSVYVLPSIFNSDLDRGFSIIDYHLNEAFATAKDLEDIKELGISLILDFVLNHLSVLSKQFQDMIKNGENSDYIDFFIDWNRFWEGYGYMSDLGYIQPKDEYLKDMFFRKPGLPLMMITLRDGAKKAYWNTFYQKKEYRRIEAIDLVVGMGIQYATAEKIAVIVNKGLAQGKSPEEIDFSNFPQHADEVKLLLNLSCKYLGQMDLNINSPLVWEFFEETLSTLQGYGADIIRLDAFAYASKKPGARNFLNEPEIWDLLNHVDSMATKKKLTLLPEIHASYDEMLHLRLAQKGYLIYDFFLPGLVIHALEKGTNKYILKWIDDILNNDLQLVNMLGCHDGIPVLDLKGLLPDEEIQDVIDIIVQRGGIVKDLHGSKTLYYQVNATYFSALGEDKAKMLFARALQMFMPGRPQVWYLDLFSGKNDYQAVELAVAGEHKAINRTNLSLDDIARSLENNLTNKQLDLLRFRNTCPAFGQDGKLEVASKDSSRIEIIWRGNGHTAIFSGDFRNSSFEIVSYDDTGKQSFLMDALGK